MKNYAVIGTIIIVIITSILVFLYIRKITSTLHLMTLDLRKISIGDISWEIPAGFDKRKDEFGEIALSIDQILKELNNKVRLVYEGANMVKDSANEVAQGNMDLSHRTENQASGLEETASSMGRNCFYNKIIC